MKFRPIRSVNHLVIHCSATPPDMDIGAKEIDSWHRAKSWLAIGYHIVIRRNGTIEMGRPLDAQGAHVRGHNDTSIGICMVGGTDANKEPEDNFTDAQWASLRLVMGGLRDMHPIAQIVGHYQMDDGKACPSFNVPEWMEREHFTN